MTFTRKQHTLFARRKDPRKNAVLLTCHIPMHVYRFAKDAQAAFAGQGKANTPTLADIYHDLAMEGAELALSDLVTPAYLACVRGFGERSTPTQIKFEAGQGEGADLIEMCQRLANGNEDLMCVIANTEIAVSLMETAIAWRAKIAAEIQTV